MFANFLSSKGRIGRLEYCFSVLLYIGFLAILDEVSKGGGSTFLSLLGIFMFWFLLTQGAKRCHDINNSGWCQLIPFYFLWMVLKEGDTNVNDYGISPKKAAVPITVKPLEVSEKFSDLSPRKAANVKPIATLINTLQQHKAEEQPEITGQTNIEIANVGTNILPDVLRRIRSLNNINSFNYSTSGSTISIIAKHERDAPVLPDDLYKIMPGIDVLNSKTGRISIKIK